MQPEIDESIGVALNVTPQTVEAALAETQMPRLFLLLTQLTMVCQLILLKLQI